ncbi:MAG: tripartite tricarboxylate transporter TctB family protein [Chloroflexota bacterium]
MTIKGTPTMYIGILALMLIIIVSSIMMKSFESKVLPLIFGGIVFFLAAVGLWQEMAPGKAKPTAGEGKKDEKETGREGWLGYLIHGAWVGGFILVIYLLGYLVAIPLFLLTYMKRLGTRWLTALIFAVVTTLLIWGVFEIALGLELYRGLILEWLEDLASPT